MLYCVITYYVGTRGDTHTKLLQNKLVIRYYKLISQSYKVTRFQSLTTCVFRYCINN